MTGKVIPACGAIIKSGYTPLFSNFISIEFDGVDEYLGCGAGVSLDFEKTDPFSISVWVKSLAGWAATKWLLSKMASGARKGYQAYVSGGEVFFNLSAAAGDEITVSTTGGALAGAVWHHIVLTWDGSNQKKGAKVYVNGVLKGSSALTTAITGSMKNGTVPFQINARDSNGGIGMYCRQDEISVWNTGLSIADVLLLYNAGHPHNPKVHAKAANLVAYWRMGDSGIHPSIPDESGTNNGTQVNMEAGDRQTDVP